MSKEQFRLEQITDVRQEQILDQRQEWEQRPFSVLSRGIEVLKDGLKENGENLENHYKAIRKDILTPPFDQVTSIVAIAPSGVAKGSFLMGIYRLLKEDMELKLSTKEKGIEIQVITVPFALYAEASKTKYVRKMCPRFAVPASYKHGGFTPEHYRRISQFMWYDIENHAIAQQVSNVKKVLLLEASSPTCYPITTQVPVEVEGVDRGNSPAYNLALDPRTKKRLFFYPIEKDLKVTSETVEWRSHLKPGTPLPRKVFLDALQNLRIRFTSKDGKEIDKSDLSEEELRQVIFFLVRSMASPHAIERSNAELEELKKKLSREGKIASSSDRSYYEYLIKVLKIRRKIISNKYFFGTKTYDLDYLFGSLPMQLYPELWEGSELLLKFIK